MFVSFCKIVFKQHLITEDFMFNIMNKYIHYFCLNGIRKQALFALFCRLLQIL